MCRGTSLIRNSDSPGPYERNMPRPLRGRGCFLCARYPCTNTSMRNGASTFFLRREHDGDASTGVPHLKEHAPPQDPTVGLCMGSWWGHRGVGVFL